MMTELELYKFITENEVEWHRRDNNGKNDVVILPHSFQIDMFCKLFKGAIDGGIECTMMDGYFAFWMNDICNSFDIEINNVFVGEDCYS